MSGKRARARPIATVPARWLVLTALVIVAVAAYANSFKVPLVFDDMVSIQRNGGVRFGEFGWNLLAPRSVLYLTFTLNYMWAGQQVWSYHLVNLLFHLFNGFFVFLIAERLFRRIQIGPRDCRIYSALAAALFLAHPVQTESVTYISSRSELLSTFFYLLALLLFILWPERRVGFVCSFVVAILYFFGLGSKETVITLPASIFLYDFLFISKAQFRQLLPRWRFYIVFVVGAAGAIYYLLTKGLRGTVGGDLPGHLSSWHYFLTEQRVIVRYVRLIFFPVGLNLDYDFKPSVSPMEPAVLASFLFLSAIIFFGWTLRRRAPVVTFSIFWFFITLSPTSSMVSIEDVIFEHRLYLPLAGVCICFPFLIATIYREIRERVTIPGTPLAYSCLILAVLVVGTRLRNDVWTNEVRLWTDVVSKSPGKDRPYNALAFAYYKLADYDKAIEVLETARKRLPDKLVDISDSLGNFYLKARRYDDAIKLFQLTIQHLKGERLAFAYNNLGVAYLYEYADLQGRRSQLTEDQFISDRDRILQPAAEAFQKALQTGADMPWSLDSYVNASCYMGKGENVEAAALRGLQQKETFADLYTVGKVAFNNKDYARADKYFERAEKLRKDVKVLFFNHGYALMELKQDDQAIEKYLQAIRIDPAFIEAQHNLGQIYMRRHEYTKAADAFSEVLRLDPKHISSNLYLASIYISEGNKERARGYLNTVLEVSPGNQQAVQMLQQLGL